MTEKTPVKAAPVHRELPHTGGSYRVGEDGRLIKDAKPKRINAPKQEGTK